MEMDRLLIRIVLLVVTGASIKAAQVEPLDVHVKPNYSKVCEGDSVAINCFFRPGGNYKVRWYYSETPELDSVTKKILEGPQYNTLHNNTSFTLQIQSIMANDSGWYFCRVTRDKPVLEYKFSNGIQVLVEKKDDPTNMPNTTDNTTTDKSPTNCSAPIVTTPNSQTSPGPDSSDQWWIWLALAVGCTVLVVSIIVIIIITRKTEEIIYENTKPDEPGCWTWKRNKKDICDLPASKKLETIKPLRKYDTYSGNRNRRP